MNDKVHQLFRRIMAIPEKDRTYLIRVINAVEDRDGFIPGNGRGHLFLTRLYLELAQGGNAERDWQLLFDKADAERKAQMTDTVECVEHTLNNILDLVQQETTDKPAVQKPPKAPKGLPPFDANGLGRMPTDHYVAEHLGAQILAGGNWRTKQGGWEPNPQGVPSIHKDHANGGRIHITLSGREFDAAEHAADQIQAAVHATMETYGALSVDVTLSLLAVLGDPRQVTYPLVQPVYLSTKTILKNKAFERFGKDGRLMEQQIADIVNALAKLRVYFHGVKIDTREPITIEDGKLFDIEKSYKEQKDIDGNWVLIETGWVMRLGMWAALFLDPKTRLWLSDVARDVLELDHRDNRQAAQMAKFMWIRFLGCMAGRVNEKSPVRVRVCELLEKIGFLPVEAERGPHWYRRTRENLERAFGKLLNLGAVARWVYSEDCPNIEDKTPWNEAKWLDAYVALVDPASLPESERRRLLLKPDLEDHPINRAFLRAARIDEARVRKGEPATKGEPKPRRERLAPAKQTPLANAQERLALPETRAALKNKRLSLGLLQGELAQQLGISRQTYGNIERGEFAPGDRTGTAEKLLAWLDSPEPD